MTPFALPTGPHFVRGCVLPYSSITSTDLFVPSYPILRHPAAPFYCAGAAGAGVGAGVAGAGAAAAGAGAAAAGSGAAGAGVGAAG